jgi:hypothetical protein
MIADWSKIITAGGSFYGKSFEKKKILQKCGAF